MRRVLRAEPEEQYEWYVFEVKAADGQVLLTTKALLYPSGAAEINRLATAGGLTMTVARRVESLEPL